MTTTTTHPVHFRVPPAPRAQRIHVLIRLVLLMALGAVGCSSLYWVLYLALPALAALRIATLGGERYLAEDGPRMVRALRWLAGAYGYLWMLTDTFPTAQESPVDLEVETSGAPTTASALVRLVYSLPALALLAILSFAAGVLWFVGALVVLVRQRLPEAFADFLALTLRYQFRLVAYHLSLVDRYPSLESEPVIHQAPQAGAV